MVTGEQLGAFKDEALREFREADWLGKLAVSGAAFTLGVEWLFNEAIVGTAGGQALAHTHNALQTMLATGTVSTVEQAIFGTSAAFAISRVPALMQKARDTFYSEPAEATLNKFSQAADKAFEALALGVSLPLILRNAIQSRDFGENMGQVGRYSVVIGLGNFALAGVIVGIAGLGEKVGAQGAADIAVNVLSNPLVWLGSFGLYRGRKVIAQTAGNLFGKLQNRPAA